MLAYDNSVGSQPVALVQVLLTPQLVEVVAVEEC